MQTTALCLPLLLGAAWIGGQPAFLRQAARPEPSIHAEAYRSYFDNDARLKARLTIREPAISHLQLWKAITQKAKAPIGREAAAAEFDDSVITMMGRGVSARAWMDAVAARVLARWERTEKNGYQLLVSERGRDFVYGAKSEWERERFEAGLDFIREFNALPAEQQAQLLSGKSHPVAILPAGMVQSLSRMLDILSREFQEKDLGPTVEASDLFSATFRLQRKPARDFNRFFITVKVPGGGSTGFRFNDYEQQKEAQEAKRQQQRRKGELDTVHRPRKFEVSQEEAKQLPVMQQIVSLNMKKVTLPEVLQRLHEKYDLAFVSETRIEMPQFADVSISSMPLGEALDRLTEIYADTEWEWRKYGVLIVRGPTNPARSKKEAIAEKR